MKAKVPETPVGVRPKEPSGSDSRGISVLVSSSREQTSSWLRPRLALGCSRDQVQLCWLLLCRGGQQQVCNAESGLPWLCGQSCWHLRPLLSPSGTRSLRLGQGSACQPLCSRAGALGPDQAPLLPDARNCAPHSTPRPSLSGCRPLTAGHMDPANGEGLFGWKVRTC